VFFHVTQAKRKLKQRLSDELPRLLSYADGMAADGIYTPPPFEIYTTDKADLGGYPSLELIVTDSTPRSDSYASIYRHRIVIGVTVGGDTEETLSAQVERYLWCLRQVAKDSHLTPSEGTVPIDVGGEQYTPLQQRPETVESPFVKGAFIEVFITTVE
jgi:hypothetical protein